MSSPFPGMDPYLEAHWLGVHSSLVAHAADSLNARLPDDLVARPEERLSIDAPEWAEPHAFRPDVKVFEPGRGEAECGGLAVEAAYKLVVDLEPVTERFIKIIRPDDERMIAAIEFLSPANKQGKGLGSYCQKRSELIEAGVHVVEIDLVRAGDWEALLRPHTCPPGAIAAYRTIIRVGGRPECAYVQPMPIDRPLPEIAIPLRPHDPRVGLDLQKLLEQTYVNGRYGRTIDYSRPLDPPLMAQEMRWAGDLLAAMRKPGK